MDLSAAIEELRHAIETEFKGCCPPCSATVKRALADDLFIFAAMEMTKDGEYPTTMAALSRVNEIAGSPVFDKILATEMRCFYGGDR